MLQNWVVYFNQMHHHMARTPNGRDAELVARHEWLLALDSHHHMKYLYMFAHYNRPNGGNSAASGAPFTAAACTDSGGIGSGWKLVRRVKAGNTWHPSRDSLHGTEAYGTFVDNPTVDATFSKKWDENKCNWFLFATGDGTKWMVMEREAVMNNGNVYANRHRRIVKAHNKCNGGTAAMYSRCPRGGCEDPWLSTIDHRPAIGAGEILFGEASWGGTHAAAILPKHKGANVFCSESDPYASGQPWYPARASPSNFDCKGWQMGDESTRGMCRRCRVIAGRPGCEEFRRVGGWRYNLEPGEWKHGTNWMIADFELCVKGGNVWLPKGDTMNCNFYKNDRLQHSYNSWQNPGE